MLGKRPIEFEDVICVIENCGINHPLFADDKQLYTAVQLRERGCWKSVGDVQAMAWCASRRLQLNAEKTEVIRGSGLTRHLQQLVGSDLSLTIGTNTIKPSAVVRDLGVRIDAELTV